MFLYFLLLLNAFFISYAYGLNSMKVKVVDHSLPPLKPAVVKTPAKPTPAKTKPNTTGSAKTAPARHPTTASAKGKATAGKKPHGAAHHKAIEQ